MMKKLLLLLVASSVSAFAQQKDYAIKPVPFTAVKLNDNFWSKRIETNRTVTIPTSFKRCETTGRVKNFQMAAAKQGKFGTAYVFDDTDIYKTIEGASFSLAVHPDPELDKYVDSLIDIVAKAQEPDGYLYTARTINPANPPGWSGKERWEKEHEQSHELYNSGHLFEAAVAHYQSTGKKNFFNIAKKNADLLVKTFGPNKRSVTPGHEIVEMGLVKMYRATGNVDYLNLAKFFVDQRGTRKYDANDANPWKNGMYWQDHKAVVNQDEAVGHAVRAMYLYAGATDVAALTGDKTYIAAMDKLWDNMVGKKIYVQGGIGAVGDGERFGANYELPNSSAYNETCAAIGNVYWNERMFLLHGKSKYIDVLEKVLYNGLISGVGLDGNSFFYTNALQIDEHTNHKDAEPGRSGWFTCSCCPTNMARFLPSLPGYIYANDDKNLFVNLFIASSADITLGKQALKISQENNYPWDGQLKFAINPTKATNFNLKLRLPGWLQNQAIPSDLYAFKSQADAKYTLKVNAEAVKYDLVDGYITINRKWKAGDKVELSLPLQVQQVVANPILKEDAGKIALQRGPVMYCGEWTDNANIKLNQLKFDTNTVFTPTYEDALLNGVTILKADATDAQNKKVSFKAIPYYAWANRGKGDMQVWFLSK